MGKRGRPRKIKQEQDSAEGKDIREEQEGQ
jgi:hypothetical protein